MSVPDSDAGIETTGHHSLTVERNGINLTEVAGESMQASTFRNTPNFGGSVIASRNNNVSLDFQAPHTGLVANQDVLTYTLSDIPHSQVRISRAGYGSIRIRHLETPYSRVVTT